jgi:hypothetical protein
MCVCIHHIHHIHTYMHLSPSQRDDYQQFLLDRVSTIRVWRSLQGSNLGEDLEDFYCLRGLEPYLSPSLHSQVLTYRSIYLQTVLDEQFRIHRRSPPVCLAEMIQPLVAHLTEFAMQRARRAATIDEAESLRINLPLTKERLLSQRQLPTRRGTVRRRSSCIQLAKQKSDHKRRRATRRASDSWSPPDSPTSVLERYAHNNNSTTANISHLHHPNEPLQAARHRLQLVEQLRLQNKFFLQQLTSKTAVVSNHDDDDCDTSIVNNNMSLQSLVARGLQQHAPDVNSGRYSVTEVSRRLLQEHQMIRRDSLAMAESNSNSKR